MNKIDGPMYFYDDSRIHDSDSGSGSESAGGFEDYSYRVGREKETEQ